MDCVSKSIFITWYSDQYGISRTWDLCLQL